MITGCIDCVATSFEGKRLNEDSQINHKFMEIALESLDYIHALCIRHGDIALRNILRNDKDGRPVMIDFAIGATNEKLNDKESSMRLHSMKETILRIYRASRYLMNYKYMKKRKRNKK